MKVHERFLKYAKIMTPSKEESTSVPTSTCQFDLAHVLVEEMLAMGIKDARVDEKCYVYGSIPATPGYEEKTKLGFIAHMDTVENFTERQVHPLIHENYNGETLVLGESGRVLDSALFPHLQELKGRTLITSDGTTILGADDKAGVAEILSMAEELLKGEIPHGKICIGFTPDEEVGTGADHFDVEGFGADFAYTVDGGKETAAVFTTGDIVYYEDKDVYDSGRPFRWCCVDWVFFECLGARPRSEHRVLIDVDRLFIMLSNFYSV